MEKQDEKLKGLADELTEMEAIDAVVITVDSEGEKPGKQCNTKQL